MENKAIIELKKELPSKYTITNSESFIDEEYRVDLEIKKENKIVLGIQVKPISYKFTRYEVKSFNKIKNSQYKNKVEYLYYNDDEE